MKINFLKNLKSHVKKALDDDEVKKDCTSKRYKQVLETNK